jgi:hypothetical protein
MISLVRQGLGIAHVTMTQTVAVEETVVEGETKAAANNISTANNMFLAKNNHVSILTKEMVAIP